MKTNILCSRCKQPVEIETELSYSYYCPNCDENLYGFETTKDEPIKTVRLYAHIIEYWWEWSDYNAEHEGYEHLLSESDEEHICKMLADNFVEGQLCSIVPDDTEIWGWWKIQR